MVKVSVFIAASLDGYIAREDGDIEWLHNSGHGQVDQGEDFGYETFISTIDALVMGRNTYEKVLSFGGTWPYGNTAVFVLSNSGVDIPPDIQNSVSTLSGHPKEIIDELKSRGHTHLYLDGGQTIQHFLAEGLVDQMIITHIPVLIGSGIPLFGSLKEDVSLKLVESKTFPNGFVKTTYEVFK